MQLIWNIEGYRHSHHLHSTPFAIWNFSFLQTNASHGQLYAGCPRSTTTQGLTLLPPIFNTAHIWNYEGYKHLHHLHSTLCHLELLFPPDKCLTWPALCWVFKDNYKARSNTSPPNIWKEQERMGGGMINREVHMQ